MLTLTTSLALKVVTVNMVQETPYRGAVRGALTWINCLLVLVPVSNRPLARRSQVELLPAKQPVDQWN